MKDNPDDAKDQFAWKWSKGAATTLGDFRNPVSGSNSYRICLYDASGRSQPIMLMNVPSGGTCAGKPCWKVSGPAGYSYGNKAGTPNGITRLKLKAGPAAKSSIQAKGKGVNLPLPTLGLTLPATVQLVISDPTAPCFQATYTHATKNTPAAFGAKGP